MLIFNLEQHFLIRGIDNPVIWLQTHGFHSSMAYRLVNHDYKKLDLKLVERLCRLFQCDLNSLVEWIPDTPDDNEDCMSIFKKDTLPDMREIRKNIPLDKQKAFLDKVTEVGKEFVQQKSK